MAETSVDIILRARDEASKKFGDALRSMRAEAEGFNNATAKQQQIASQFGGSGISSEQLSQMQEQFEQRTSLEDRYYAATHTSLETALRDHDSYFDQLKTKWQFNESMLTMVSKTQAAERQKIFEQHKQSAIASFAEINKAYAQGAKVILISRVGLDAAGGVFEGINVGIEDGFAAGFDKFVEKIPFIGRAIKYTGEQAAELILKAWDAAFDTKLSNTGIKKLEKELTVAAEKASKTHKIFENWQHLQNTINDSLRDTRQAIDDVGKSDALIEHEKRLRDIDELIGKINANRGRASGADGMRNKLTSEEDARYQATLELATEQTIGQLQAEYDLLGLTERQAARLRAQWEGLDASQIERVDAALDRIEDKQRSLEMSNFAKTLDEQIASFGKDPIEAEIAKWSAMSDSVSDGAWDAYLMKLLDMEEKWQQIKQLRIVDELKAQADAVRDFIRTPVEEIAKYRDELNKMLAEGLLTADEFDKAMEKRSKQLQVKRPSRDREMSLRFEESRFLTYNTGSKENRAPVDTANNTKAVAKNTQTMTQIAKQTLSVLKEIQKSRPAGEMYRISNFN